MLTTATAPPRDDVPATNPVAAATVRSVERLRLIGVTLMIAFVVFSQASGATLTDTKIDLVVSPLRFLKRALVLWDPLGAAGQMQNQAYGYLFPMGPFFALAHSIDLPPWEIQRLWQTTLSVVAFLGVVRLARLLGVPRFWPPVAAGVVYVIAPRFISELPYISSELMPVAALPWILIPLVRATESGSPRRAGLRAGVAFLFAGGVNAAASIAVLPVPALWLLTRERGHRRSMLIRWSALGIALASLWWLIPLVLLGRYSPPFLDWVESATTTTVATPLLSTLRGVDHWESLLGPNTWPSGWILATAAGPVLATTVVASAGLWGAALSGRRIRLFLFSSLFAGLVLVTLGHVSEVGPPFAEQIQKLLDGPLVPFRNVHKFDPVIRLPLALGFGVLVGQLRTMVARRSGTRHGATRLNLVPLVPVIVVATIAVAMAPLLNNQVANNGRVTPEPGWWKDTSDWLAAHDDGSRALLVPSSAAPVYLWGPTIDTALQPVAKSPWSVRDAVPLAQAGYVRLLDQIDVLLADGRGTDELAPLLRRSGIGRIVLANDLEPVKSHATPQLFSRSVLESSPGISLAQSFGPRVGTASPPDQHLLDAGAARSLPSVQIYTVAGRTSLVTLRPLSGGVTSNGSNDALGAMTTNGLDERSPVFFGGDARALGASGADQRMVLTEGIRKQQASFGNLLVKSETMTASQAYTTHRGAYDYLPDGVGPLSTYGYSGISDVTASSSGSQLLAFYNRGRGNGPWSALDGDEGTAWYSSSFSGALQQWIEVSFDHKVSFDAIKVAFAKTNGPLPIQVVVTTDSGVVIDDTVPLTGPQYLAVPAGETTKVRVTIAAVANRGFGTTIGISELSFPGITPRRTLVVPGTFDPDEIAFTAEPGARPDCLLSAGTTICDPSFATTGEEDDALDRTFTMSRRRTYDLTARVRLRAGPDLDRIVGTGVGVRVTSVASDDVRQSQYGLVDGTTSTSWQAAEGDSAPTISLDFPAPRVVESLTLEADETQPIARPRRVTVTAAGGVVWSGTLADDGVIRFGRPVATTSLRITIDEARLRDTTSSISFATRLVTAGVSEILVNGESLNGDGPRVDAGCPSGFDVLVDGARHRMRLDDSASAALSGEPVTLVPCDSRSITLEPGRHDIRFERTGVGAPVSVRAVATDAVSPRVSVPDQPVLTPRETSTTRRTFLVESAPASVLQVRENFNSGWSATIGDLKLVPVKVDGWQQGFVVPARTYGVVTLEFTPQHPFRIALLVGLVAALVLLFAAWAVSRDDGGPARGPASIPLAVIVLVFGASVGALAGVRGLVLTAVLAGVTFFLSRVGYRIPVWLGPLVLLAPAVLQVRTNAFDQFVQVNSSNSQLLCVAALSLTVLGCSARQDADE